MYPRKQKKKKPVETERFNVYCTAVLERDKAERRTERERTTRQLERERENPKKGLDDGERDTRRAGKTRRTRFGH